MLLPKGWRTQHNQVLLLPTRVRSSPLLSCSQETILHPGSWKQARRIGVHTGLLWQQHWTNIWLQQLDFGPPHSLWGKGLCPQSELSN